MTNHLHLLLIPADRDQPAIFMLSKANGYVRYFNAKHQRTGTIWEGRFKSCLIDSESYMFILYKYIEMNPVMAGMVDPVKIMSGRVISIMFLVSDKLITEHLQYKKLGKEVSLRCKNYKALLDELKSSEQDKLIAEATMGALFMVRKNFIEKWVNDYSSH